MTLGTDAKAHIADQLARSPSEDGMNYMAIGTGTPSGTALGTEIARKYLATKTHSGAVITYTALFEIDDEVAGSITEAGIFNNATLGGTMLCSTTFVAVSKLANDLFEASWTVTIT